MTINIKTTNTSLTTAMADYVEDRLNRILKYSSCAKSNVSAFLGLERFKKHRNGDIYKAEIELKLPVKNIRVQGIGENWLSAFGLAKSRAQRELKKYKETKCQPVFNQKTPELPLRYSS